VTEDVVRMSIGELRAVEDRSDEGGIRSWRLPGNPPVASTRPRTSGTSYAAPVAGAAVAGAAIGAAAGAAAARPYYGGLPCTPATVVVGGTTYYQCGSTWCIHAYSGGDVIYTIVNPPPGY